jgi:hypothetical protein
MTTQQKFKEIFGNSNIFEIISFHKYNINNPTERQFKNLKNLNDNKLYSIDNYKELKNKVVKFDIFKKLFIAIYEYLSNYKDSNDIKYRLSTIINNWVSPTDKKYKKLKFRDLWNDFGEFLQKILSFDDSDIYFKKINPPSFNGKNANFISVKNIYQFIILEYNYKYGTKNKFGLCIFKNFIDRLKYNL